jgi:carbohydrate kinase (thermoresistant glucokinase family)
MIVVLMGVSGVGKTTIGRLVAARLGWRLIDADDHHPPESVAKMAAGIALQDSDRWPWLDALNRLLRAERDAVIACSALKQSYRQRLLAGIDEARLVYLYGTKALIASRLAQRKHRYMPASLLDSQFATLEPPGGALAIDVAADPETCAAAIVDAIRR